MRKGRQSGGTCYWVPVDEELPKESGIYIVTIKVDVYPLYHHWDPFTTYKTTVASWHPKSGGWNLVDDRLALFHFYSNPVVIAWAPLPGVYFPSKVDGEIK